MCENRAMRNFKSTFYKKAELPYEMSVIVCKTFSLLRYLLLFLLLLYAMVNKDEYIFTMTSAPFSPCNENFLVFSTLNYQDNSRQILKLCLKILDMLGIL